MQSAASTTVANARTKKQPRTSRFFIFLLSTAAVDALPGRYCCTGTMDAQAVGPAVEALWFQPLVHDQCIDITPGGVLKGLWQPAHRGKTELIPESHRAFIGRGNEIELHGLVT